MEKSTHRCEVVIVHPQPHPNADRLDVVQIHDYICVTGKGNFLDGELGIYIPPDSIVPQAEEFKFIWESRGYALPPEQEIVPEKYRRVKSKKIRGTISEGLLMPVKDFDEFWDKEEGLGVKVGDDVAELLGVTHYNPPDPGGLCESAPVRPAKKRRYPKSLRGWISFILSRIIPGRRQQMEATEETGTAIPAYDVDAWQRYGRLLVPGEEVWITEKIHGCNARYVFMNGRMYAGSHYQWKKEVPGSDFWEALKQNSWITSFCTTYPGFVLYGELVPIQTGWNYGQHPRQFRVFAFDVYCATLRKFFNLQELKLLKWCYIYGISDDVEHADIIHDFHWVPTLFVGPYDPTAVRQLSVGPSLVFHAGNKREGIVIKTTCERVDPRFGRVILKLKDPEFKD